ncbi:hypothetical protein ILYODFUR_037924 [Ilyodon furcidens]|uniref:TYW2 N-terminal domain-containing protein n=1 Tax=Ilyodon furcidens TaxID=33524 RepID=A0ABV0VCB0_9TELE
MDGVPCLRVSRCQTQQFRGYLQSRGMLDQRFNLVKHPDGTVLLPILSSCLSQLDLLSLRNTLASDVCDLTWSQVTTKGFTHFIVWIDVDCLFSIKADRLECS